MEGLSITEEVTWSSGSRKRITEIDSQKLIKKHNVELFRILIECSIDLCIYMIKLLLKQALHVFVF